MTSFVKHEACPRCGSRDNLGRYSDGSAFCFGCRYYEKSNVATWIKQDDVSPRIQIPQRQERRDTHFDPRAIAFLRKSGLSVETATRNGIYWNASREQLIFSFYDKDGNLCCTQARNFNPKWASKAKYYNVGNKGDHFTIYGGRGTGTLVFTEDALSSLRIAPLSDAHPLLGTSIAKHKLMALKGSYSKLLVWLDADKFKEAVTIAQQAKWMGWPARAIYSELDPKSYTEEQIANYLKE